jgi:GT2 family glycosyltransferase
LKLKGSFEICLIRIDLDSEIIEEYTLLRQKADSDEICEFDFIYPQTVEKGVFSFKITAFENGEFQGGAYHTNVDENNLPNINLALCICTYKRENYIISNMEMLKSAVFTDKNSLLNQHLRVYIADNGQTLDINQFDCDEIKIYPNLNTGGSGGFSRAMIEAIADRKKLDLTHIILMDDDVVFTYHALERSYSFLQMLKSEHKNIMLGGAMLKLDLPFIQHGAGETWSVKEMYFNKTGYNLYDIKGIVRNEIEESINQLAWWFCCFPLDENSKNNLALPIFFQYDDIDFNLRNNHLKKVTLNGICLWHESFEKKLTVSKEYYAVRNRFIICSIHGGAEFTKKFAKKLIVEHVVKNLMMYRYKAADLILRAVEDFFKGYEWLAAVDQQKLNSEVNAMGYKLQPIEELSMDFKYSK